MLILCVLALPELHWRIYQMSLCLWAEAYIFYGRKEQKKRARHLCPALDTSIIAYYSVQYYALFDACRIFQKSWISYQVQQSNKRNKVSI